MIDVKWEGCGTEPFVVTVTREWVRRYAAVIGEHSPLYHDPAAARAAGNPDILCPPAMPCLFWQFARIPWLDGQGPLLHREQTFFYREALVAGRSYVCRIFLRKIRVRKGGIQLLEHELLGWLDDAGSSDPGLVDRSHPSMPPLFTAGSQLVLTS